MSTTTDKHYKVVRTAASVIANAIAALPAPIELASVYNVMASQPVNKNVLYEAFETPCVRIDVASLESL